MGWVVWALLGMHAACDPAEPEEEPQVSLELAPPWRLLERRSTHLALALADSPHGVRIQLRREDRVPGVSPVWQGRTLEVAGHDGAWPLVAVAFPERPVEQVEVAVEGVDLLVRFEGPPVRARVEDPGAPDDPVLTWVRLRPRPDDWRIVLDGLGTVSLPSEGLRVAPGSSGGLEIESAVGRLALDSSAARVETVWEVDRWRWSNVASLQAFDPYPRTGVTWVTP